MNLDPETKKLFQKAGFYVLDEVLLDERIDSILKKREFVEIELSYGRLLNEFLADPTQEKAEIFADSFVVKETFFGNLKNRYQTRMKDISEDPAFPKYSAFLLPYLSTSPTFGS